MQIKSYTLDYWMPCLAVFVNKMKSRFCSAKAQIKRMCFLQIRILIFTTWTKFDVCKPAHKENNSSLLNTTFTGTPVEGSRQGFIYEITDTSMRNQKSFSWSAPAMDILKMCWLEATFPITEGLLFLRWLPPSDMLAQVLTWTVLKAFQLKWSGLGAKWNSLGRAQISSWGSMSWRWWTSGEGSSSQGTQMQPGDMSPSMKDLRIASRGSCRGKGAQILQKQELQKQRNLWAVQAGSLLTDWWEA